MATEETFLQLYDSYWFELTIFSTKPTKPSLVLQLNNEPETEETKTSSIGLSDSLISRTPTLIVRSFSDHLILPSNTDNHSPNSVLVPKLQSIPSGKEIRDFSEVKLSEEIRIPQRRRKKKGNSKSLSELEFEELKGFMDLGFVFSDEDKDSSLVSIVPGLQTVGKKGFAGISRPYLSEAWECLEEKRKVKDLLVNWRIPEFNNEIDLKDHLKVWAHSVASTVR